MTGTPHEGEWYQLITFETPRLDAPAGGARVFSKHAAVTIVREHLDGGRVVYRLAGGRLGAVPTWRAALPGCTCDRPSCSKPCRIRGYQPPGWTYGTSSNARQYGRQHPDDCNRSGCHGGSDMWRPADVLALARKALESWEPVRKPTLRAKPIRVPFSPRACAGCGSLRDELAWHGAASGVDGQWLCPPCLVQAEAEAAEQAAREEAERHHAARLGIARGDAVREAGALARTYGGYASRDTVHLPDCPSANGRFSVAERITDTRIWVDRALSGNGSYAAWCDECLGESLLELPAVTS